MCCLFGIADWNYALSQSEKNQIVRSLSIAAEVRGTDATGIAYNAGGKIHIYKRPMAAHRLMLNVPNQSAVVMGHTRMTTQGSEVRLENNHPFPGVVQNCRFALAHNGVLHNDKDLRKKQKLPKTTIETDSYVAVQLIEKQKTLDLTSLKYMAEKVRGSFAFTILDQMDNLYFVKGENPLCIYQFDNGVLVYASTKSILETGLRGTCLSKQPRKELKIYDGEILCICPNGNMQKEEFDLPAVLPYVWPVRNVTATPAKKKSAYRDFLVGYGQTLCVPDEEMVFLSETDLSDADLELALYDAQFRECCLDAYGYYGDDEEEKRYDYFGCYGW